MPIRSQTNGTDAVDDLQGGDAADLIYGYDPASVPLTGLSLTRVGTGFNQPLFVTAEPGDDQALFVVEKTGIIRVLDPSSGAVAEQPFLDLSGQILTNGEQGLLGLALAPDFRETGRFYVDLINLQGNSEIREYRTLPGNPALADSATSRQILIIDQPDPFSNHKAGWLAFGPDGYLYAAVGDGGGAGDPLNNAQNPDNLLGKILRLDVSGDAFPEDPARNYAVAPDNPFVSGAGADEIWALGLRNPWRPGFDQGLGNLWITDVGQSSREEIDIGTPGANYGWSLFEGLETVKPGSPAIGTLTQPIFTYGRDVGQSIVGGAVYRGDAEVLQGNYLFADFVSGRIWSLKPAEAGITAGPTVTELTGQLALNAGTLDSPSSFGDDGKGNLYLVDIDGEVFRLDPQGASLDIGDTLRGGAGDDMLFGGAGNDLLLGGTGSDELIGQSGNDLLEGGSEDDLLRGGAGTDTAVFTGERSTYTVTRQEGETIVAGPEGADTLLDNERLRFSDGTLALAADNVAGQVFRLYIEALDREPEAAGLGFHIGRLDAGFSVKDLANGFINSSEFQQKYGALTNEAFVAQLYDNLRAADDDPAGFAHHLGRLEEGISREDVLIDFSESPENQAKVAPLIDDGMWYV